MWVVDEGENDLGQMGQPNPIYINIIYINNNDEELHHNNNYQWSVTFTLINISIKYVFLQIDYILERKKALNKIFF